MIVSPVPINVFPVDFTVEGENRQGYADIIFQNVAPARQQQMLQTLTAEAKQYALQAAKDLMECCRMQNGCIVPICITENSWETVGMVIGIKPGTITFYRMTTSEALIPSAKNIDLTARQYIAEGHRHCPLCIEFGGEVEPTCAIEQRIQQLLLDEMLGGSQTFTP